MGNGVSTNQVKIYQSCDFKGKALELPLGKFSLDMLQNKGYTLDKIGSLKVGPKTIVFLYENADLSGRLIKVENISDKRVEDIKCLADRSAEEWTNNIQSITIQRYMEPGEIPEDIITDETANIEADKLNKLDLKGVNQRKVIVKDLDKPLNITNIDGICVMKHVLNNKDKLTEKDMINITKKCTNILQVIPPDTTKESEYVISPEEEKKIENFNFNLDAGRSILNDNMLLVLLILGFILTYFYLSKRRSFYF